jgi:hypothetical protein
MNWHMSTSFIQSKLTMNWGTGKIEEVLGTEQPAGLLERRELDPAAAGPAAGEDGALDEAVAGGADAEVELVELAVAGLVAVALHVGLEPGALPDGALDLVQRVVAAVGVDAGGGEGGEDAKPVAEAERRLEVAVLVEDVGGAGAVLLPLVAPEAEPVVGRARQRRPLGAQAAQQVAHLQCIGKASRTVSACQHLRGRPCQLQRIFE